MEDSKKELQTYKERSCEERTELQEEVAVKGDQINELANMVAQLRSQVSRNDSVYSTDKEEEVGEDEVRSCDEDEGEETLLRVQSMFSAKLFYLLHFSSGYRE